MTPERFRTLWKLASVPFGFPFGEPDDESWKQMLLTLNDMREKLREALTAFVKCDAMREKAEHKLAGESYRCDKCWQAAADWIKASWDK